MTLICSLIYVATSLLTAGPSRSAVRALTWSRDFWRHESKQLKGSPWYHDYRYQSAALLALALIIVVVWW